MSGILYGVGVGPGDPDLITYQAVKTIEKAAIIAVPGGGEGERTALAIAEKYIGDKPVVELDMPMVRDKEILRTKHDEAARILTRYLEEDKDVAFLTLGDPSIYSTYGYLHRRVTELGFEARFIAGVPSFCAAAARLNRTLCEGNEPLHLIPASYDGALAGLEWRGTKVLMKSGKKFKAIKEHLRRTGQIRQAAMVERCGMDGEQVYPNLEQTDETAEYFSLLVVKEAEDRR